MASAIFVVLVLSEGEDLVIFMDLAVVSMEVLLVGRAMAAEVDKISAAEVAVSAMDVFKKIGAVITSRGGDVVLAYDMVV